MIDALAQMFLAGLVDRGGRFQVDRCPARFQISPEDERPEFILVPAREAGNPRGIVITQADVENLIRTKGAIYAAAACLVNSIGLSFADIQKVYIAGAFGNKLNVTNCVTIACCRSSDERIHFIGNSSVAGAKLAMLSEKMLAEIYRIRERITYEETDGESALHGRFSLRVFPFRTPIWLNSLRCRNHLASPRHSAT